MPTIRRHPPAAEPQAPAPLDPGPPGEHSLSALQVPGDTTPTWELEMLVSGAVLFGLFQLPDVMSGAFVRMLPRLGETGFAIAFESYLFAKAMLYALIAGFVLHLASRAYWVALVGLDSVFPSGIRWDKATVGPITREVFRQRFTSLPARIERIDNFASVLFASAFGIVFLMLSGLGLAGVLAGATWLITRASHGAIHFRQVFYILLGVFFAGPFAAYIIDKRAGDRLAPDGAAARFIRAAALLIYRFQGVAIHGPITQTLFTNVRRTIVFPAMILTIFGAMGAGVVDLLVIRGHLVPGGYGLLPSSGAGTVDSRYYADQRTGDDRYSAVPFIQSDVLHDPYARLFVPYLPRRADVALARSCPGATAAMGSNNASVRSLAGRRLLGCLAGMRAVSLDGRAVDPDYRFFGDPESGLRGLLGYVPLDGLARGRHVLVVQPLPLAPTAEREDSLAVHADSIPFRL